MEEKEKKKELKEINKQFEEVVKTGVVSTEPGYLYYINKKGDICKMKKGGVKRNKPRRKKIFSEVNITVPTSILRGYVSDAPKTVRKFGGGAMVHLPSRFIGKSFRVILIPESELEENTVNLF